MYKCIVALYALVYRGHVTLHFVYNLILLLNTTSSTFFHINPLEAYLSSLTAV